MFKGPDREGSRGWMCAYNIPFEAVILAIYMLIFFLSVSCP